MNDILSSSEKRVAAVRAIELAFDDYEKRHCADNKATIWLSLDNQFQSGLAFAHYDMNIKKEIEKSSQSALQAFQAELGDNGLALSKSNPEVYKIFYDTFLGQAAASTLDVDSARENAKRNGLFENSKKINADLIEESQNSAKEFSLFKTSSTHLIGEVLLGDISLADRVLDAAKDNSKLENGLELFIKEIGSNADLRKDLFPVRSSDLSHLENRDLTPAAAISELKAMNDQYSQSYDNNHEAVMASYRSHGGNATNHYAAEFDRSIKSFLANNNVTGQNSPYKSSTDLLKAMYATLEPDIVYSDRKNGKLDSIDMSGAASKTNVLKAMVSEYVNSDVNKYVQKNFRSDVKLVSDFQYCGLSTEPVGLLPKSVSRSVAFNFGKNISEGAEKALELYSSIPRGAGLVGALGVSTRENLQYKFVRGREKVSQFELD